MRLIDADELCEKFEGFPFGYRGMVIQVVADAPTVDLVKHGRWEFFNRIENCFDITGVPTWANQYKCKNCGFVHTVIEDFGIYSYCPNCGASMLDEVGE